MANFSFLLTEQTMKSLRVLNDRDFRVTIEALFNYNNYGTIPDSLPEMGQIIFEMTKPIIDYQRQRWTERGMEFKENKK